jgi:hypothetical protein
MALSFRVLPPAMKSICTAQKRAIRVMLRLSPRSSCKEGFKKMDILTVPCLYMYAMTMFVNRNCNIYEINNVIHQKFTRQFKMLYVSSVTLSLIQRGVFYSLTII